MEESMSKAARLTNEEDKGKETLDADLWGQLQEHIPLQTIYEKLSQRDLFQVRIVSKEWNHAALRWTLPKPYFVTKAVGFNRHGRHVLNWVVKYDNVSGKFNCNRQRFWVYHVETHVPPFEVEGLIFCHNQADYNGGLGHLEREVKERGVFNVHTQTWHAVPAGPEQSETLTACGLVVDTSVRPYTFKLIEGNINFSTQVYDSKSRSWTRTSSRLPLSFTKYKNRNLEYSCICKNDDVYMSDGPKRIWKYSLRDDKWTVLKSPNVHVRSDRPEADIALGVWEGRIFTTRQHYRKRGVTVWELVDSEGEEWVEYACMPKDLYKWLWKYSFVPWTFDDEVFPRSFFRDGHLLVCSWRSFNPCASLLVLFDMATKSWRKVDLPRRTVTFDEDEIYQEYVEEDEEGTNDDTDYEDDETDEDDDER